MAYEGPKGPWAEVEEILINFGFLDDENTKFEWWNYDPDYRVYRIANSHVPTNILIKFEQT